MPTPQNQRLVADCKRLPAADRQVQPAAVGLVQLPETGERGGGANRLALSPGTPRAAPARPRVHTARGSRHLVQGAQVSGAVGVFTSPTNGIDGVRNFDTSRRVSTLTAMISKGEATIANAYRVMS